MPLSRRYTPEKAPGESSVFGMDFSYLIPVGVGISSGALAIATNTSPPVAADGDWTKGTVSVHDRTLYATLGGGKAGTDYQLTWTATDSNGNIWPRTALCLCALTS
jgi:hypothetical protein